MQELWPFSLEHRNNGTQNRFSIVSSADLNLLIAPASFMSIRDAVQYLTAIFGLEKIHDLHSTSLERTGSYCPVTKGLPCRWRLASLPFIQSFIFQKTMNWLGYHYAALSLANTHALMRNAFELQDSKHDRNAIAVLG